MAKGPKGRGLRYSGQPTNLAVRKAGQSNVNQRKNRDVSTTGKNLPGKHPSGAPVRKIGTPYNLPEVAKPAGL